MKILYQNGGYIIAPANHIMSDVPLEKHHGALPTAR